MPNDLSNFCIYIYIYMKLHRDWERPDFNSYSKGVLELQYIHLRSYLAKNPPHITEVQQQPPHKGKYQIREGQRTELVKNGGIL